MNILIAGAAGFIGTNLTLALMKNPANHITITDTDTSYFTNETIIAANNVSCLALHTQTHNFENILENIDLLFHLVSTTNPSSSIKRKYYFFHSLTRSQCKASCFQNYFYFLWWNRIWKCRMSNHRKCPYKSHYRICHPEIDNREDMSSLPLYAWD